MDKGIAYKKSLRAHRRTASSNLQDLCFKPQFSEPLLLKPKQLPLKQKDILKTETDPIKITFYQQNDHEVVKLIKASSELVLEKRVIMDSFQEQQQKINKSLSSNFLGEQRVPFQFTKGERLRQQEVNDYQGIDGRSFKKKPKAERSDELIKQSKKKPVWLKKNQVSGIVQSEYLNIPQPSKVRIDKGLRFGQKRET